MGNREQRDDDLDRELRSHLELEAEEQRQKGLTPEESGAAARRALGNTALIAEATREAWGWRWLDRLWQDVRYGCRMFFRQPRFAVLAILTAALGIGANTAIFSVVYAVLLQPLPYPDAGRLVSPSNFRPTAILQGTAVGDYQYASWRDAASTLAGIAEYDTRPLTLTGKGDPEQLRAGFVTPGFLATLGVAPLFGHDFTAADAAPHGGRVALLSYSFWKRKFAGDRSVVGKQFLLDGNPYTVGGVMPRSFEFPGTPDVSLMFAGSEPEASRDHAVYWREVIARLKPGVPIERAESDLQLIVRRLDAGVITHVITLHDRLVGNVRPALLALAGAVGLVLLIVCVNIANLLLARAIARQKEMSVRIALGAGRLRVFRQLLTEGMLLACAGAVAGLGLAMGGVKLLQAIAPAGVPHIANAGMSGVVLAFNAALAVLSGILFGFAPLRAASLADPETALKQSGRAAGVSPRYRRLENLLVVAETAFALILLAGAGLLLRTFASLTAIPPGFQPEHVLTARISLPFWKYPTPERQHAVLNEWLERAGSAPGVESAGLIACLPYGGFVLITGRLEVEGRPERNSDAAANSASGDRLQAMSHSAEAAVNFASGDYFQAMRIPILEGRAIGRADEADRPGVAVVNETLVRRYLGGLRPIGTRVRAGGATGWLEIVGVARDQKQLGLASEPKAEMWTAAAQSESGTSAETLVLRSTADPRVLIPWLRARASELDPDIPPPEIATMRSLMAGLIASQVFVLRLLAAFAVVAVLLAAIGIYSVLVYSVERRSHEIGIRLALGAKRAQIAALILGRGLRLSAAGALLGVAGAWALTSYLKTLLYGVTPHDPVTLLGGAGIILLAALSAAWLPARRAMRQDPSATLRAD